MNQVNNSKSVQFETAIKNVGLFADDIWTTDRRDKEFVQKNQDLWIKFRETEELCRDANYAAKYLSNVETVSDRIPYSRLSAYGNFIYDRNEELFYNSNYNNPSIVSDAETYQDHTDCIWMHAEVIKEFHRLTESTSSPNDQDDKGSERMKHELEQKRAISLIKHPPIRYFLNTQSECELHMRLTASRVRELWEFQVPGYPSQNYADNTSNIIQTDIIPYNCEVPEFYPKSIIQRNWHMLPSASDPNYQVDLFPYQAPFCSQLVSIPLTSQAHIVQLAPTHLSSHSIPGQNSTTSTSASMVQSWIKNSTTIAPQPIPVFQRPPEFYAQSDNGKLHRKRGGVEFSNLILLEKNSDNEVDTDNTNTPMEDVLQTKESTTNGHKECEEQSTHSTEVPANNGQHNNRQIVELAIDKETLNKINVWLRKLYPQRCEQFSQVMNTVDTMYSIALQVNNFESANMGQTIDVSGCVNNSDNSDNNQTGDTENKFAQLEQEALEQYHASDDNIAAVPSEDRLAQQYQDLEREAMEQYRGDRDDWATPTETGEDKGGVGHTEEVPIPPGTSTALHSRTEDGSLKPKHVYIVGVTIRQEISVDHQVGTEEEEAVEEENLKKEVTRDTDSDIDNTTHIIDLSIEESNIQIKNPNWIKAPIWMKQKKKKHNKKRKTQVKITKQKKDITVCNSNQENMFSKTFLIFLNEFYSLVQHCLRENKKTKVCPKKLVKQLIQNVNRIRDLIFQSETLDEFKYYIEAIDIFTTGNVITPCVQLCHDVTINYHEKKCLQEAAQRIIVLESFSKLFTTYLLTHKQSVVYWEDYRSIYMTLSDNNNIDGDYNESNGFMCSFNYNMCITRHKSKICKLCFVSQTLSKLAWSWFNLRDPLFVHCSKDNNIHNVSFKNSNMLTLCNNIECKSDISYDKYHNMWSWNNWQAVPYLIDENSGKYFVNHNLYGLIKDWSWIYYFNIYMTNDIMLDSVNDELGSLYIDTLSKGFKSVYSLIYQISWFFDKPCHYCEAITLIKCFNETNFASNLSEKRWKSEILGDYSKGTCKSQHLSRPLRRSQKKPLCRSIIPSKSSEQKRFPKKSDKQHSIELPLKRIQSEGVLDRKRELLYNDKYSPIKKRLRRNVSLTRENTDIIYKDNDILYNFRRNHKNPNTSFTCQSDQFVDRITFAGDEPTKDINLKYNNNPHTLKRIKTQNIKPSIICIEEENRNPNLNNCSHKHSCIIQ